MGVSVNPPDLQKDVSSSVLSKSSPPKGKKATMEIQITLSIVPSQESLWHFLASGIGTLRF